MGRPYSGWGGRSEEQKMNLTICVYISITVFKKVSVSFGKNYDPTKFALSFDIFNI